MRYCSLSKMWALLKLRRAVLQCSVRSTGGQDYSYVGISGSRGSQGRPSRIPKRFIPASQSPLSSPKHGFEQERCWWHHCFLPSFFVVALRLSSHACAGRKFARPRARLYLCLRVGGLLTAGSPNALKELSISALRAQAPATYP